MQRYLAGNLALLLAVLGTGSVACEDHRAMPLEPGEEPRMLIAGEGFTTIDGIEFYVYEGGYYPRAGVTASIWEPKTIGDIWPNGGSITATFDYRGHGATQSTTWLLERASTGDRLAGSKAENYGSGSGIALSPFRKTYTGSFAIAHPYECDLRLTANTDHSAWWIGVVIVDDKPYIAPGKWGTKPAFSTMPEKVRTCALPDGDGGDVGGDGDGDGDVEDDPDDGWCNHCQEWLHYSRVSGEYLYSDWECSKLTPSACQELMS